MASPSDSEFVAKTRSELARLVAEAALIDPTRGHDSARRWAEIHVRIDDHLAQLRGEPEPDALIHDNGPVGDPHAICCSCGQGRYIRNHTLLCGYCDGMGDG